MDILDIGDTIRLARRERGITQLELSELSGVSRGRINQLERGRAHDMTMSNLVNILEALDLSLRIGEVNSGRPVLDDIAEQKDDLYDSPGLG